MLQSGIFIIDRLLAELV